MSVSPVTAPSAPVPVRLGTGRAHPVRRLLLWRVPLGVLSVALVSMFTYFATRVLPGDAASAILGQHATPASLARLRAQLGLDESAISGYLHWAGEFLSGTFGKSLSNGQSVTAEVMPHLVNSLVLVVVVAVFSTILGVLAGVLAAYRRDGLFDDVGSVLSLVASALPEFVVGVFVVYVFAAGVFSWFPAVSILPPNQRIWDQPEKLVLPALTLLIVTTPYMFRMVRAATIEALNSDYAEVARLKGASPTRLLFCHALPNAVAPAVQVSGLNLLYLAGGIVLVETVFQFPGIGLTLVEAVRTRDVTVLQFIVVLLAIFYVSLNIVTDLIVLLTTPRRRAPR
ncbi:MAG: ABC transporter permease [Actinobacteria bacterium]|nr:ABC transporter permease [Actinomycetota bacterium]